MSFSGTKGCITKPKPGVILNLLHPLSKGLVGYWLFNEGAGSLANDISGNGNHGRLTNMAPNVQGSGWGGSKFGGGLEFDGSNDYVDSGNFPAPSNITISAGVYLVELASGDYYSIVTKRNDLDDIRPITFDIRSQGKLTLAIRTAAGWHGWITDNVVVTTNTWHHVAMSYDGVSDTKLYVDGVLKPSTRTGSIVAIPTNDRHFYIGQYEGLFAINSFNGIIDKVQIYNRTLSAAEVKQLYHDPFCNLMQVPIRRYSVAVPPVGAIINQFQRTNIGADLYNGVFA